MKKKILIIAAHPDDEILGCGGYLSKYKKPVNIEELQSKVWGYQSELETHTVETHIYRLRKKILKVFNDENFIISKKSGYQIS